jgi:hypothetical protein
MTTSRHVCRPSALAALLLASVPAAAGPGPNVTTIPITGQDFSVVLTAPAEGFTAIEGETITVEGQATIGDVAGVATNIMYVVDVSGSTQSPFGQDCNGDGVVSPLDNFNGDARVGDVLDCEIAGVLALNESLSAAVMVDGGLVALGQYGLAADVDPAPGHQYFTAPLTADHDGNLVPDLEQVARSLRQGVVGSFRPLNPGTWTNYDAALSAMQGAFSTQPAGENNVTFFLSDGQPTTTGGVQAFTTGAGSPLQLAADAGTVIHTFSVGTSGTGCGVGAALRIVADTTGGTCTAVSNPADLSSALPGLTPALLDRVEVDGAVVAVDALGNFTADVTCDVVGPKLVTATAFASDPDGTVISADVLGDCLPLNQPPVAICADVIVPTEPGTCAADASVDDGSYDPDGDPITLDQSPAGPYDLGITAVTLTVTDDSGAFDTCDALVAVEDVEAPVIECNAPATIIPPDAPVSFTATASDNCDPAEAVITAYDCYTYNGAGKRIDKTNSCVVGFAGDVLTIDDSGGVGDIITWTVEATDDSGNTSVVECSLDVVRPGKSSL